MKRGMSQSLRRPPAIPVLHDLCPTLELTLYFLDTLGSALYLPVLPAIVREVLQLGDNDAPRQGVSPSPSPSFVAMIVGLLVGTYYAGRSLAVAAASSHRGCSAQGRCRSSGLHLRGVGAVLCMSVATYLVSGLLVVVPHRSLWWFAVVRLLSGALAATPQNLAVCNLPAPAPGQKVAAPHPRRWDYLAQIAGLVLGYAFSGPLFTPGHPWPTLRLCLAAILFHVPSFVLLLIIWRNLRSSSLGRGGGGGAYWSALASSSESASVSGHYGGIEVDGTGRAVAEVATGGGRADEPDRRAYHGVNRVGRVEEHVDGSGEPLARGRVNAGGGGGLAAGDDRDVGMAEVVAGHGSGGAEVRVPERYLRGCKGDAVEAERRWRLTLEWRAAEKVDEVLQEPQPHFDVIKRHYPHFMHRRARNGCPVWVELPGKIDLPAIRSSGVSSEALRRHYVFVTEYLWGVVEPDFDRGQAVTILDVEGLGMRDLAGEALGFVKQATAIVQDHYVERSNRMFIINAPSYFSMIWRGIRPMLNERTQAKIAIINNDKARIAAALLDCIAPENLPARYGGTCPLELGDSEEETDLRAYVTSITPSLLVGGGDGSRDGNRAGQTEEDEVEVDFRNGFDYPPSNSHVPRGAEAAPGTDSRHGQQGKVQGVDSTVAAGSHVESGRNGRRVVHGEGQGDANRSKDGDSTVPPSSPQRSAARRVVGKVGGLLGWAGGKLAWRRAAAPPVAHLGEENAFVYDKDLQQWILKRDAGMTDEKRGGDGDAKGSGIGGSRGVNTSASAGQVSASRPARSRESSMRSNTSEEMTVLAIQAAHLSLQEAATSKLTPSPNTPPPAAEVASKSASATRDVSPFLSRYDSSHSMTTSNSEVPFTEGGIRECNGDDELMLVCPCRATKPPTGYNHEAIPPTATRTTKSTFHLPFGPVGYAVSVAIRESIPVWALASTRVGGLGNHGPDDGDAGHMTATPSHVGLAFAAGIIAAEAGQAVVSYHRGRGCLSGKGLDGRGTWCSKNRRVAAVYGRLVTVAGLGVGHVLTRMLGPSSPTSSSSSSASDGSIIPAAVVWTAMVSVVAMNHTVLRLCGDGNSWAAGARRRRVVHGVEEDKCFMGESEAGSDGTQQASPPQPLTANSAPRRSLLVADVLASAGGPLFLALGLSSGWPTPFDASVWFLLYLCVDMWLALGARGVTASRRIVGFGSGDDAEDGHRALELSNRGHYSAAPGQFAEFV